MFWHWQTVSKQKERILREELLSEAEKDAISSHPGDPPSTLCCPITRELLTDPLITPWNGVYERQSIERHLREGNEHDPLTRHPLSEKDLSPFPELLIIIETFKRRHHNFLNHQNVLITKAREINHKNPLPSQPNLFFCPLTNQPIKKVCISADGTLYDEDNVKKYLNESPEGELANTLKNTISFDAFQQQINLFNAKREMLPSLSTRHSEKNQVFFNYFSSKARQILSLFYEENSSKGPK